MPFECKYCGYFINKDSGAPYECPKCRNKGVFERVPSKNENEKMSGLQDIIMTYELLRMGLKGFKRNRRIREKNKKFDTYDKSWYDHEVRWYMKLIKRYRKELYQVLHEHGFMKISEKMLKKRRTPFCRTDKETIPETEVIRENAGGARQ